MAILYDEGLGVLYEEDGSTPLYDESGPPVLTGEASIRLAFAVGPAAGDSPVQGVTAFSSATFKRNLKAGPEISFTMPANSPAAMLTDGLATDVWVFKKGALWLRCRTMPVDQEWGENGESDATVTAVGYKRVVGARNIIALGALPAGVPLFNQVDQGTILWNLIQHTQAQTGGNLGIGLGTVLTGIPRDRTEYLAGDNLGKIMDELGDVINGVWWDIDSSKLLQAKRLSAFPVRTDPIVLGRNARSMKVQRGLSFANVGGAVGSKTDTVVEWAVDASVTTDPRGRWEAFDSTHSTANQQARVTEYAAGLLAERLHPPSQWTISLDPAWYFELGSDYNEGEFVNIVVPVGSVDEIGPPPTDVMAQVTEIVVSADDSGTVGVTVTAVETSG